MAVTYDTAANVYAGTSTKATVSITVGSNDNRVMVAWVCKNAASSISSVTYAGDSLTLIGSSTVSSQGVHCYAMVAPATGTNDLVVTISPASWKMISGGVWYDAEQSITFDDIDGSGTTSANSISVTLTTTEDNSIAVFGVRNGSTGDSTAGSGTQERGALSNLQIFESSSAVTPAGNVTLTADATNPPDPMDGYAVTIAPAAAAASTFIPRVIMF